MRPDRHARSKVPQGQDDLCLHGICDVAKHPGRCDAHVLWHIGGAQPHCSHDAHDHWQRTAQVEAHRIAVTHAKCVQGCGEAIGCCVELTIGQRLPLVLRGYCVGLRGDLVFDRLDDGCEARLDGRAPAEFDEAPSIRAVKVAKRVFSGRKADGARVAAGR